MVEQKYVNHRQLSRQLGLTWKQLSASEKQPFINEAQHLRLLHAVEFPNYKEDSRQTTSPAAEARVGCVQSSDDCQYANIAHLYIVCKTCMYMTSKQ